MKHAKTLPVLILALTLCLCACSSKGSTETTGAATAAPTGTAGTTEVTVTGTPEVTETAVGQPAPTETTKKAEPNPYYTVTVVDENGNPISDVAVQLCTETSRYPGKTNAEGIATFSLKQDSYTVRLATLPSGYDYAGEEREFAMGEGTELTVTLKESDVTVTRYTVVVTDDMGNPISGVQVKLSGDSGESVGKTDEDGVVQFTTYTDSYTVSLVAMPEGYAYLEGDETFEMGEDDTLTVVLKAID